MPNTVKRRGAVLLLKSSVTDAHFLGEFRRPLRAARYLNVYKKIYLPGYLLLT